MKYSNIKSPPLRGALISSGIMAFAGLGDAILYPILPVYSEELGIPLIWVGLILSISRFVRIISNTWIANQILVLGMKKMLIITSCLAVFTTIMYGIQLGLVSFLIARIIWGISYSGLKISTLNYAAKVKKRTGLIFGLTQSIKSIGALFILWMGPKFIEIFGITEVFFLIGAIGLVGIFLSFTLPKIKIDKSDEKIKTKQTFFPSPINLLVNILAISIDGILVVTLASLLSESLSKVELLGIVAFFLLLKRLFMVIISILAGVLSLKVKAIYIFNAAIIFSTLGIIIIAFGYFYLGIIITFLFNAIIKTFSPLISISKNNSRKSLQLISSITTWWDLGAGIGALVGLVLINILGHQYLFTFLALLISILFINFIISYGKANRTIVQTPLSIH